MKLTYLKNGNTLDLNTGKCTGCKACLDVCPHGVFKIEAGKARIALRSSCMECGACARNCPVSAITVHPGVGCAAAIIIGKLRGTAPTCGGDSCCAEKPAGGSSCC